MSRPWSLYAAERHITDRVIVAGVWVVRAYWLTRYAATDRARRIGRAR